MRKRSSLGPLLLTFMTIFLLIAGGMYILSGMGLAAAGGGVSRAGAPHYEIRKNYKLQSTLEAPQGYSFTGDRVIPKFVPQSNMIGLGMNKDKAWAEYSLGIYDYLTGRHIYTYDYPEDPRRKRELLTHDAIYNLYVRDTDNEGERISKIQDARVCWDKHNITTEKTTTLCFDESLTGGRRNYISPDGRYIIINGRDLDKGRGYELFIISSETGELVEKISMGDGSLEASYGGKFVHSYSKQGKNGENDYRRDWYTLDFSQLRLVKTNETPAPSPNKYLFKTKEYYSFRDFPHNPQCATEYNTGRERQRVVICKTSFVVP